MSDSKTIVFSPETAARIAQRVNALDGLSDDALDGGWNFKDYERLVVNLEKQRKELLKALKEIYCAMDEEDCFDTYKEKMIRKIAIDAIDKVKGKLDKEQAPLIENEPKRQPLSNQLIAELWNGYRLSGSCEMIRNFAREIEKAHGIGE